MSYFIVDLDGTLADNRWRTEFYEAEKQDWNLINELSRHDKPYDHILNTIHGLINIGIIPIFMTARSEESVDQTRFFLSKYELDTYKLMMRPLGNNDPDATMKGELIEGLLSDGFEIIMAIEDNSSVVEMMLMKNIPVLFNKVPGVSLC